MKCLSLSGEAVKPDQFDYIRQVYKVPVSKGIRVRMDGRLGTIIGADQHLQVRFDDEPKRIGHCHPTWKVTYCVEVVR